MSANDHLVDSPVKLGTCNRCGAYVYLAHSSGIRSAADVAPAGRDAYVAAALDGRRHFDLVEAAGRPSKLVCRTSRSPAPVYDPGGAQIATQGRRKVLVEHGCGGHAQNMIKFTEIEKRPTATVCDTWKASGWAPPPGRCARDQGQNVVSCDICDKPPFDLAPEGAGRSAGCGPAATAEWIFLTETAGLGTARRSVGSVQGVNVLPDISAYSESPNATGGAAGSAERLSNLPERGTGAPVLTTSPQQQGAGATKTSISRSLTGDVIPQNRIAFHGGRAARCGTCRKKCEPGTYFGIQRGAEWVWCEHDEGYCT